VRLRRRLANTMHAHLIKEQYGVKVGTFGEMLLYVSPMIPIYIIIGSASGWVLAAIAALPAVAMIYLAQVVHPFLHARHSERQGGVGLAALIMRSRYGRAVLVRHWLHHAYGSCNYNLIIGGDFLLRVSRRPSFGDLRRMVSQHVLPRQQGGAQGGVKA
jgi:hypothetical protein